MQFGEIEFSRKRGEAKTLKAIKKEVKARSQKNI